MLDFVAADANGLPRACAAGAAAAGAASEASGAEQHYFYRSLELAGSVGGLLDASLGSSSETASAGGSPPKQSTSGDAAAARKRLAPHHAHYAKAIGDLAAQVAALADGVPGDAEALVAVGIKTAKDRNIQIERKRVGGETLTLAATV